MCFFFKLSSVICYEAFSLHFLSLCSPVFCPELRMYLIPLQSLYLFYDLSKRICKYKPSKYASEWLLTALQTSCYSDKFRCFWSITGEHIDKSFIGINEVYNNLLNAQSFSVFMLYVKHLLYEFKLQNVTTIFNKYWPI